MVSASASSRGPAAILARQNTSSRARSGALSGPSIRTPGEAFDALPRAGVLGLSGERGPVVAREEGRGHEHERREMHRRQVQLLHLIG